ERNVVAIEPVSNINNAINLLPVGSDDRAMRLLPSGERFTVSMEIRIAEHA
ncbi:aldose 1-epimerase, partial [Salmonella enterica]|nr:aldose 1-epimerase [Salmonella enterica]